jgi:acylphosphatase
MQMDRLEARVEGRVQGVCFRYCTRRRATELGLSDDLSPFSVAR